MNTPLVRHGTRWLLLGAALLVGCLVALAWLQPGDLGIWKVVAAASVCLLVLAALGALLLARAARALGAARLQLSALESEVRTRQEKLAEFANLEGRFVGNIAHEIKSPLAVALVQIDLLRKCSNDPGAVLAHAKGIGEDLRHLAGLVDSFLRLARPFAQAETTSHVPVALHDVVVDAARRSQSMARDLGIVVVLRLAESHDGEDPVEVLGDAVLLEAMLENLLRNAVRFAPRSSKVEVEVRVVGESCTLKVSDHGAGIPIENVESVFDWFFQAPGSNVPATGTGFGLAIARRVAEHHGGSIALREREGGGCEFEITLPRWREEEGPAPAGLATRGPRLLHPT